MQFTVSLQWGAYRAIGASSINVAVEGCSTSSEAIDKAIAICKPLREDAPSHVSADHYTFERAKPKQVGNGTTTDAQQAIGPSPNDLDD